MRFGSGDPDASVVIRTFNEERRLSDLLEALAGQRYRNFEVIVVDSGSFDRTCQIAAGADRLLTIDQHDFTFGHSLNVGIRAARGRFVAIISAHTIPVDEFWMERLVAPLSDASTALVYGQQRGWADSKFAEVQDFTRTFGNERRVLVPPHFFANNANSAIRRDLWEQQPFDETLPGLEDIAWAKFWMERGYRVLYEPSAAIYHLHDESWPQVRHRYYREGQAAKWIGLKRRRDAPGDIWREARSFLADLGAAAKASCFSERAMETARFRYEKLVGTVAGVWDGAAVDNPTLRQKLLFDRHYEAVVIRSPGQASLARLELPELKPSEMLVRVAFEGICATDIEVLKGELGYYKDGLAAYPIVPGHELSGTIAAVGARVADFGAGDHVVVECIQGCGRCAACESENAIACASRREVGVMRCDGGYAQYVVTQARFVHRVPSAMSLKLASLCEPTAVVLKGLRRLAQASNGMAQGECAVVGAGPIGHLAARILADRGFRVTVFDRDVARLAYFRGSSIRTAEDVGSLDGVRTIIEATGNPQVLETVLLQSAPASTILLLGLPYARRQFNFESIVAYDKTVVGSVGSTSRDFDEALATLPRLDTSAFGDAVLPLAEFARAWDLFHTRRHLKVTLHVDSAIPRES